MLGASAESSLRAGRFELPPTLHGQLFLLAYDRRRHRFDADNRWRFGLALRIAMLADLYLSGHVADDDGAPRRNHVAAPLDPVINAVLDEIGDDNELNWGKLAAQKQCEASATVRSQLEADGFVWVQWRRLLGVISTDHLRLNDELAVGRLADDVTTALRDAIAGRPADQQLLAVGLIGALGQLPTVLTFDEASRHDSALEHLADRGLPPIAAMRSVIDSVHRAMEAHTKFFSEGA